jgi:clan AA aspartic protease (TIGR02281 family)
LAAKEQLSDDLGAMAQRKREDADGINIPLMTDNTGHFYVEVVLNNNVHASLIVDTGAPVVLLSSRFIQLLDLNVKSAPKGFVTVLNGKYQAAEISLNSLQLGDAEGKDVTVAVLLEDNKEIEGAFKDGLLGLSFLSKFHFALDQEGQRLILRKNE